MFDATGQEYYVSGLGSTESTGSERIARGKMGFLLRVYHHHGLGFQYLASARTAHYGDRPRSHQTVGTVSLVYALLGENHFGAVDWHDSGDKSAPGQN